LHLQTTSKMKIEIINPNVVLNKVFLKQSVNRADIELFKKNLMRLFARINDSESEEHNKNIVSDFLKDTYYKADYEINTAGRKDLVIHLGKSSAEPVAVIIEAKRPDDKTGMIAAHKPNAKAIHELMHYYLNERLIKNNLEIRNLIITDIYQWYIFDATEFERILLENKQLTKTYKDWHDGVLAGTTTEWFYLEIAKPFFENEALQLKCTYFNLRDYEVIIKNEDKADDTKLVQLYKILSPQHLLKLSFSNDSNYLNKDFYNELLHILGLCEVKKNGTKTIERLPHKERNEGSLIENTISILKTYDKLSNLPDFKNLADFEEQEQLFSVALELCITWINRILFLKLLEGQLIKYNEGSLEFAFLNSKKIKDFDELGELFFDVLAVKTNDRSKSIQSKYANIPYLNSSLFEISEMEKHTISIYQLKDRFELPIYQDTVLKEDATGAKLHGNKPTLQYLFQFLDSYNFASENAAQIQEQNKTIINAAVLGLLFEKINGYKEGSFFTPGFITMFICKQTVRQTILQKFNSTYHWNCPDFDSLINYTERDKLKEYSNLVNSIRICDPAVGSGHFLVSILNEIIAAKADLKILLDVNNKHLRDYDIFVENDELQIISDNEPFRYNFKNRESQRVQEALFHEKQTIIENCLFGVDINPKSVQICRLRLWIELLKHSYYISDETQNFASLHIPNIETNILYANALDNFEFPKMLDDNGSFVGFDLVVGNPPYYRMQYSDFDFKAIQIQYKTFDATGDIYSLFIEKATKIVKENSLFSFIVSNRFCNTNYGATTRKFMSELKIDMLLNINNVDVFEEANVGTLVFIASKQMANPANQIVLYNFDEATSLKKINQTVEQKAIKISQKYFTEKQWIFKNSEIQEIKLKMEKVGTPFSKISNLKINSGLKTSMNDVFIVDKKLYHAFIESNSKNAEILKPLLRGGNIKRYSIVEPKEYLILTKSGVKINNYPEIYDYLLKHKNRLDEIYETKRGKRVWYELRQCAYYEEFEKEKLIWTQLASESSFAISTNKEYSLNSTSIATGKNVKYYCAVLNSKAVLFYFKLGSVIWGKDGIKWFGDYFDNIPIPVITETEQKPIVELVDKIIELKKSDSNADTSKYENEIDHLVYGLYNLNEEDVKIIEK